MRRGRRSWFARSGAARTALLSFCVVVTILFGYLAVRDARLAEVWGAWRQSNYWWLVPTFALLVLSVALRAFRWWLLFAPKLRPGLGPIAKASLLGLFFNTILPARAGEVSRIVALKSYAGTPRSETTATILLERLLDVLALLGLLFATLPWLPHVHWLRAAGIVGIVALVVVAGLAALTPLLATKSGARFTGTVAHLPFLNQALVVTLTEGFLRGLGAIRRPRQAAATLACTIASWLILGVSFWCLMIGFRLHLPLLAGLLVVIATGLGFIIPAAPAAVGIFEAAGLAATSAYGVPTSRALAYMLVLHMINVVPYLVAGLVVLAAGRTTQSLRPRFSITGRQ